MPPSRTKCISLLLLVVAVASAGIAMPPASSSLTVGWSPRRPYQYREQSGPLRYLTGFDVNLVRAMGRRADLEIEFRLLSWEQNLDAVRDGRVDVALGAFRVPEREAYATFSQPIRRETDVLFTRHGDDLRLPAESTDELLAELSRQRLRIAVIAGYYYGPEVARYLEDSRHAELLELVANETEELRLLAAGRVDGVFMDHLVGRSLEATSPQRVRLAAHPVVLHEADVHLMYSRASVVEHQREAMDEALAALLADGEWGRMLRRSTLSDLMTIATSGWWFVFLDYLGTVAFAISGVLIARQEGYSLLGALVLALLPGCGGGLMRDLLLGRRPLGMLESPVYLLLVVGTVVTGYLVNRLLEFLRRRELLQVELTKLVDEAAGRQPVAGARPLSPYSVLQLFDAIGLAAFTVIGVAVAVRYGAEPLWIWGPLAAALTGAGGGILRDIVRASADAATLRTSLYAEVAVAWGLLLSLALLVFPHEVRLGTIQAGIVITVVGVFLTRMAVVGGGIRSPSFR